MKKTINEKFNAWLQSTTGKDLLNIELRALKKLKYGKSSNTMVVIGETEQQAFFNAYQARENFLVTSTKTGNDSINSSVIIANADELPLLPNSVDFILLPHTLDFNKRANHILREVNICLQPEGYLIIVGFNPYSLWGLRRFFSMRIKVPWCGYFRPMWRIKDALTLLNYEVIITKRFIYRPHAKRFGLFKKLAFLESFIHVLFPFSGAVYILVAKKRVFGITPLRLKWAQMPKILNSGAISPTRRTAAERE